MSPIEEKIHNYMIKHDPERKGKGFSVKHIAKQLKIDKESAFEAALSLANNGIVILQANSPVYEIGSTEIVDIRMGLPEKLT